MGNMRLRDQEWFLLTQLVAGRIFRSVLCAVFVGVGLLGLWGGLRTLAAGSAGPVGWALVVLGTELALVSLFFLWLNLRRSLSWQPASSIDAAIARAQEHDRREAEGLLPSNPDEVIDQRGPPVRRVAGGMLAIAMLTIAGLLVYGLIAFGTAEMDVLWIGTTGLIPIGGVGVGV